MSAPGMQQLLGRGWVPAPAEGADPSAQWWLRPVLVGLGRFEVGPDDRQQQLQRLRIVQDLRRSPVQPAEFFYELGVRQEIVSPALRDVRRPPARNEERFRLRPVDFPQEA